MKKYVEHYVIFKDNENLKQAYNKFKAVIAALMRQIPNCSLYFYDDLTKSIRSSDKLDNWYFRLDTDISDDLVESNIVKFINGYDLLVDINRKFFKEHNNANNQT